MHFFGFIPKYFPRILAVVLIPLTLASLRIFVFANEPDDEFFELNPQFETNNIEQVLEKIEALDIGSEFLYEKTGTASYYGKRFHNRRTANGERYNMYALSAAHRKLPFGTVLRVTNLKNDEVVFVRINDRGPYIRNRIIDLSYGAAKEISGLGLPKVKVEGMIPPKTSINDSTSEYYFGYSYQNPLVCLPLSVLNIVDSTDRFYNAVDKYEEYIEENPEKMTYLFIPSERTKNKGKSDSENTYYIATIIMGNDLDAKEELANK